MGKYALVVCCMLLSFFSKAQNMVSIKGVLMEEKNHPVPLASVELWSVKDSSFKRSTSTSDSGVFVFDSLPRDDYELHVSFVGYTVFTKKITALDFERSDTLTDTFHIVEEKNMLPAVQVTANKNFMTVENDKKVFNVGMMGGVASGTASDVMQQIPLVDVDKDGNISLRGKAVNVLIDGKPSPYTDIATALQMIPASGIDKVEVMTSPSAKFDAEGQGGILNIVLKKDKAAGFHGVVNLDAATFLDYHGGTDFNFRKKHINVFGNLNFHSKEIEANSGSNQYFFQDSAYYISQLSNNKIHNTDIDARLGVDYFINDNTTLTLTQAFSDRKSLSDAATAIDSGSDAKSMYAYGTGRNHILNHLLNSNTGLDFAHKFRKEGEQLTANALFSDNVVDNTADLENNGAIPRMQHNNGNAYSQMLMLQADYTDVLKKNGKLEAGYKSTLRSDHNDVDALLYDTSVDRYEYNEALSSQFAYQEQVHALYAAYANSIGSFHYKAGLRTEWALMHGNSYLQDASFDKQYFNFFPSVYFSKDLAANQSIGLSYATRITRPTFMDLLPYVDISNPVNYKSGNLDLVPAYTQNIEVNYSKLFGKSNNFLSGSAYYNITNNSIQLVTEKEASGYTLTKPQNIARSISIGSDIIYRFSIKKIIRFTVTADGSYNTFDTAQASSYKNAFWNWDIRLNGEINMPARLVFLAHGEMSGPQALPQGYSNKNKGIDAELRRMFFHDKITAALIVSDVFNDRREISHIATPGFIQDNYFKENSRMLHVHISYRF